MNSPKKLKTMDIMRNGLEETVLSHGFVKTTKKRGVYFRLNGETVQEIMFDTFRVPYIIRCCVSPIWDINIKRLRDCYLINEDDFDISDLMDKIEGHDDLERYHREPSYRRWECFPGDVESIEKMTQLAHEKMIKYLFPILDRITDDEGALRFSEIKLSLRTKQMHTYLKEHPIGSDVYGYLRELAAHDPIFALSAENADFDKLTWFEEAAMVNLYSKDAVICLSAISESTKFLDNRIWYCSKLLEKSLNDIERSAYERCLAKYDFYTEAKAGGMSHAELIAMLKAGYQQIRSEKVSEVQGVFDELKIPITVG